jgi:hypothetical protein
MSEEYLKEAYVSLEAVMSLTEVTEAINALSDGIEKGNTRSKSNDYPIKNTNI